MEVESTIKVTGLLYSLAEFLGVLPFHWNSNSRKVERFVRQFAKIRRTFVLCTTCTFKAALLIALFNNWKDLKLARPGDFVQIIVAYMSSLSLLFDLHLEWKKNVILQLINSANLFYSTLLEKYIRKDIRPPKINNTVKVLVSFVSILVFINIGSFIFYFMVDSRFFVLALLVPSQFCDEKHFLLAFAQFMYLLCLGGSYGPPTLVTIPWAIFAHEAGRELSGVDEQNAVTVPELQKTKTRIKVHNTIQAMNTIFSDGYYYSMYPVALAYILGVLVFCISALVKIELPFSVVCLVIAALTAFFLYLIYLLYIPASAIATVNVHITKFEITTDKYNLRIYKCTRPVAVTLGGFAEVTLETFMKFVNLVIEWTMNILLTLDA